MTTTTIDATEKAPVGSVWETDVGTQWRVIAHIGGQYVKLQRVDRPKDTYVWHVKSLTDTTAQRVS